MIVILHIDHANEKYGAKTHMKQFGVILDWPKKVIGMEKLCPYIYSHMSNGMSSFQPWYWYAIHIYMDQNYEDGNSKITKVWFQVHQGIQGVL